MKVMALYLPQFHEIPENNKWWGKGYTEWTAVKNAKVYFRGQMQPVVPLNNNYYDLNLNGIETWKWQAELAQKYNVDAFCIYHYWFKGKLLLEKPMEILLANKDININYCICWANESWARNWDGSFNEILIKQEYGNQADWENHFNYLLPFFQDSRYIKEDNKPLVNIYKSQNIIELAEMLNCWNKMAVEHGFDGIKVISAITAAGKEERKHLINGYYYFEPGYTLKNDYGKIPRLCYVLSSIIKRMYNHLFVQKKVENIASARHAWKRIENRIMEKGSYPGTFVKWDNTPRRKEKGTIFVAASPEKFKKNISILSKRFLDSEWLYINAWNEWGEGAYLEPDVKDKYDYLEAIGEIFRR